MITGLIMVAVVGNKILVADLITTVMHRVVNVMVVAPIIIATVKEVRVDNAADLTMAADPILEVASLKRDISLTNIIFEMSKKASNNDAFLVRKFVL
jgi:hypothetical protein